MKRKVLKSISEGFPLSSARSILLGACRAMVVLLLLSGCDSSVTFETDGFDCGAFGRSDKTGFCDFDFFDDDFVAEANFSKEVAVAQHERILLEAINGPVKISGDPDATSVTVSGRRRVGSKTLQDAESHLGDLDVQVEDRTDEVFIRTVQPQQSAGRSYVVDYTITVPEHLDVEIRQINGDVKVHNVRGSVRAELTNGVVDYLSTSASSGSVDLTIVNGSIKLGLSTSASAALSASVTNGRIDLSNLVLENLAHSPHRMTGRLGGGESKIDLAVANGTITVTGH